MYLNNSNIDNFERSFQFLRLLFFFYNQFVGIIKIYKIEFEKKLKWGDVYDSYKIFHSTSFNFKFFWNLFLY